MTEEQDDATFGETARENVLEALGRPQRASGRSRRRSRHRRRPRYGESVAVGDARDGHHRAADGLSLPHRAELVEAGSGKSSTRTSTPRRRETRGPRRRPVHRRGRHRLRRRTQVEGKIDLLRFANRVPLVYQRGACTITHVVKDIGWRNYGLDQPGGSGMPNGPAVLMVHVASTNVPFTSESKDALADVPAIQDEVELAIREAARDLKPTCQAAVAATAPRETGHAGDILPEMAEKLTEVTDNDELHIDDSLARIMNNVLVEREVEDDTVRVRIENNDDTNADVELTDIVTAEPRSPTARRSSRWTASGSSSGPRLSGPVKPPSSSTRVDEAAFDVTSTASRRRNSR